MSELSELLNRLRQTAGLALPTQETGCSDDGSAIHRPMPVVHPSEEELLLDAIRTWAGADAKLGDRVLPGLKRNWSTAGWIPDSPQDLLVAWASANQCLVKAGVALERLRHAGSLTSQQQATEAAREVDVSFYGTLSESLRSRAALALREDAEAAALLAKLSDGLGKVEQT